MPNPTPPAIHERDGEYMREIKFRVWNGEKMLQDNAIAFVPPIISTQSMTMRDCFDCLKRENKILMQYTGLKDKNGKEIYEGDIFPCTLR